MTAEERAVKMETIQQRRTALLLGLTISQWTRGEELPVILYRRDGRGLRSELVKLAPDGAIVDGREHLTISEDVAYKYHLKASRDWVPVDG